MPKPLTKVYCALSSKLFVTDDMVRLVFSEAFGWGVDAKGDLPGEAWWIRPSARLISARAPEILGTQPERLIALLDQHLLRQVQQTLSRARRAGAFCIGGDWIKQWYQENSSTGGVFLLKAHDGGSTKLWKFLSAQGRTADNDSLSQSELGIAFERVALGSALVNKSGFCVILRNECRKLALVREE